MLCLRKHSSIVQVQKILKTYDLFENEGALWTARTKEFMKKRVEEDKEKKQRRLRVKTDTRERVPTYQWMQCVQTALRTAGLKFQDFADIPAGSEAAPVQVPRVLVVCTDQESLQITAMNFLKQCIPPPRHPSLQRANSGCHAILPC